MVTPHLYLASASPQRSALLAHLTVPFVIQPSLIEERDVPVPRAPKEQTRTLAISKAVDVAARRPWTVALGADTLVTVDGEVMGKPSDRDDAVRMLRHLSGRTHAVHTGIAVCYPSESALGVVLSAGGGGLLQALEAALTTQHTTPLISRDAGTGSLIISAVATSSVTMHELSDAAIQTYVATGEPVNRAGAYAIQSMGYHLVSRLTGCYANVVGLPLCTVATVLRAVMDESVCCPDEPRCRVDGTGGCYCGR